MWYSEQIQGPAEPFQTTIRFEYGPEYGNLAPLHSACS